MPPVDPLPWTETDKYKQNRKLWLDTASEVFEKLSPYFPNEERKTKEELYCKAANICAVQDKDLLQLQSISSLTNSNKKWELEEMHKILIDKEFQALLQATTHQKLAQKKNNFEDYLTMKDFKYYVQHTRDQISNPAVPSQKKALLKNLIKDAESVKWTPKHKTQRYKANKDKPKLTKTKEQSKKEAELTRTGNTPNTKHLQKLLNEMNMENGMKIMCKIHKISEKDKLNSAKQKLHHPKATPKTPEKTEPEVGKWLAEITKSPGPQSFLPPPNVFKFFVMDDKSTLPSPRQTEEELTSSLNNTISKNVEWLINLGSNHIKTANWSKDPKAIIITMTHNIDKNREDGLPDGKEAFDTLQEVALDLFPDATLANHKPRSKLKFSRVLTQHSDGLPMDNGLLYHYIRKHPNFENIHFSLTPHFEHLHPLKPNQKPRVEYTKMVVCEVFDTKTGLVAKKCLGSVIKFDNNPSPSSANPRHIIAQDAAGPTPQPCIKPHVNSAPKALYAALNVSTVKGHI
ncbi:hypothetical protein AMATHDRAFT_9746 [Amanita thiersii Skay4041]|uniref:Uncharacterized protein n=1 Tax=Amanita thiersii Skay4041 TaxID=703135 RepID=A0A2A9N894_9AGAR|nr:hypothetical protein AMATHDRAFT_9746 [Amanita thiersii Skay4041]